MSLDSVENNPQQQQQEAPDAAPDEAYGVLSYALDALSELHAVDVASLWPEAGSGATEAAAAPQCTPAEPSVPAADPEPDAPASAEGDAPLERLQSTLDWYKDWLGSM